MERHHNTTLTHQERAIAALQNSLAGAHRIENRTANVASATAQVGNQVLATARIYQDLVRR